MSNNQSKCLYNFAYHVNHNSDDHLRYWKEMIMWTNIVLSNKVHSALSRVRAWLRHVKTYGTHSLNEHMVCKAAGNDYFKTSASSEWNSNIIQQYWVRWKTCTLITHILLIYLRDILQPWVVGFFFGQENVTAFVVNRVETSCLLLLTVLGKRHS